MYLLEIDIATRVVIGIAAMVLLFASFLIAFINSQRRKMQYHQSVKALMEHEQELLTNQNKVLETKVEERTNELKLQKEALQESLAELKATQQQLIQREKMASLGELTAGIAHEIQNPLNFVNNFSEVSVEIFDELDQEIKTGNLEEIAAIASDIKENLKKINHHGKRADSIVKGMLQHSRNSTEKKEFADLNELANDCLRLGYHGVKANEKNLLVKLETDFDAELPKILVIPQDIGRVILNLVTNALYAVNEKQRKLGPDFEAIISMKTGTHNAFAQIIVKDNGSGIPAKVIDKIFQPFFTTKPTGQGTGLGLSLSYEIVKAHGGEIILNSEEGKFTEFKVLLPL